MSTARWIALIALAGCGHAPAPASIENGAPAAAQGTPVPGVYTCAIREGGYDYPPFRCEIRDERGRRFLAKLGGSVRMGGAITPAAGGGFRFVGRRFCPWGDCTEHVESTFVPIDGGFRGEVVSAQSGPSTVTVRFERAFTAAERGRDGGFGTGPAGFGGGSYGGDPYGGWSYGGYGGDGYGNPLDEP